MALGSTQPLTEMSTRNISWGVKVAGASGWQPYHQPVPLSCNMGTLTSWNPLGHSRPVTGLFYLYLKRCVRVGLWLYPCTCVLLCFFFSLRPWLSASYVVRATSVALYFFWFPTRNLSLSPCTSFQATLFLYLQLCLCVLLQAIRSVQHSICLQPSPRHWSLSLGPF